MQWRCEIVRSITSCPSILRLFADFWILRELWWRKKTKLYPLFGERDATIIIQVAGMCFSCFIFSIFWQKKNYYLLLKHMFHLQFSHFDYNFCCFFRFLCLARCCSLCVSSVPALLLPSTHLLAFRFSSVIIILSVRFCFLPCFRFARIMDILIYAFYSQHCEANMRRLNSAMCCCLLPLNTIEKSWIDYARELSCIYMCVCMAHQM